MAAVGDTTEIHRSLFIYLFTYLFVYLFTSLFLYLLIYLFLSLSLSLTLFLFMDFIDPDKKMKETYQQQALPSGNLP